ncbi:MAG: 4Fe-4S single cluster domain [Solirubrobacteraceae bacterium]|jgi:ferredoxin|nr:4Fe-4S single cluster domain [Solirubrobacteraceae bacterium]
MTRVRVDEELCIGAGYCVRLAKSAFGMGEDNIAVVTDPDGATPDQLRLAERTCPAGAVFLDPAEFAGS